MRSIIDQNLRAKMIQLLPEIRKEENNYLGFHKVLLKMYKKYVLSNKNYNLNFININFSFALPKQPVKNLKRQP